MEPVPLDVDRLLGTSLKMQVGSSVSDPDPHEDFCPDLIPQKKCGSETLKPIISINVVENYGSMYFCMSIHV